MGVFAGTLPWALSPDLSVVCERNKDLSCALFLLTSSALCVSH